MDYWEKKYRELEKQNEIDSQNRGCLIFTIALVVWVLTIAITLVLNVL